jgi:hypothetical protein
MKHSHALALSLTGWYLLIPPVFSPMGAYHRSFQFRADSAAGRKPRASTRSVVIVARSCRTLSVPLMMDSTKGCP